MDRAHKGGGGRSSVDDKALAIRSIMLVGMFPMHHNSVERSSNV